MAGRPQKYDRSKIIKALKKNAGKQRGLLNTHETLKQLKGFEDISFQLLQLVARKEGIAFGRGVPMAKPVKAKKKAA